jgi:H+/Cl- antiporter ClcA
MDEKIKKNRTQTEDSIFDNTDDRERFNFKSKYENKARIEIRIEAAYLLFVMIASLVLLYLNWKGTLLSIFDIQTGQDTFKRYVYYLVSGLLGGITFGIKYFYRVVARGWWHQDRRVWRVSSPFLSSVIGFMTGVLIEAQLLNTNIPSNGASIVSIGFLAGYFADEAVGKMYEIANVVFGANNIKKG